MMLFTTSTITNKEIKEANNFFAQFDNEFEAVKTVEADEVIETPVSKYITSLVSSQYQKSVEDIENTKVGNRVVRKRNLQQIMQQSFYHGANRFGTNFIA